MNRFPFVLTVFCCVSLLRGFTILDAKLDTPLTATLADSCTAIRIRSNYLPVSLLISNATNISQLLYVSRYKGDCPLSLTDLCDGEGTLCGDLLASSTSTMVSISTCISDLYVYVRGTANVSGLTLTYANPGGVCIGKQASGPAMCGSLTLDDCWRLKAIPDPETDSNVTCEPKCQLSLCKGEVEGASKQLHGMCLVKDTGELDVNRRCSAYKDFQDLATDKKTVNLEKCTVEEKKITISFDALLIMGIVILIVIIFMITVICYNWKLSADKKAPFAVCTCCPECFFPTIGHESLKAAASGE